MMVNDSKSWTKEVTLRRCGGTDVVEAMVWICRRVDALI